MIKDIDREILESLGVEDPEQFDQELQDILIDMVVAERELRACAKEIIGEDQSEVHIDYQDWKKFTLQHDRLNALFERCTTIGKGLH